MEYMGFNNKYWFSSVDSVNDYSSHSSMGTMLLSICATE